MRICFCWLTQKKDIDTATGCQFFKLVDKHASGATLAKFGASEPLNSTFSNDFTLACETWPTGLFWSGANPRGSGNSFARTRRKHFSTKIHFEFDDDKSDSWGKLCKDVANLLDVDFACVHAFNMRSRTICDEKFEGLFTYDLIDGLQCLPWATCFGASYVQMIGRDRIESAGFCNTEPVGESIIFAKVSEAAGDYYESAANYDQLRTRILQGLVGNESLNSIPAPDFGF